MKEIKASTKATGKRRWASVEAAKRKVRDGQLYLIRRHGGFFRPNAQGYTDKLAGAGIYSADDARSYLDVEGLSVVPIKSVVERALAEAGENENAASSLRLLVLMARKEA